jgi:hypothetical protein
MASGSSLEMLGLPRLVGGFHGVWVVLNLFYCLKI